MKAKFIVSSALIIVFIAPLAAEAESWRKRIVDFAIGVGSAIVAEGLMAGESKVECSSGYELSFNNTTLYGITNDSSPQMRLTFDCLKNTQNARYNDVQIEFWASKSKYNGGTLNGYLLAEYKFNDSLDSGYYYYDFDRTVNLNKHSINSIKSNGNDYYIIVVAAAIKNGESKEYIRGWSNHSMYDFYNHSWVN